MIQQNEVTLLQVLRDADPVSEVVYLRFVVQ